MHRIIRRLEQLIEPSNSDLEQRNRQLLSLQAAGLAITSSLKLDEVMETVTSEMAHLLDVEACAISEWNQSSDTVSLLAEYGPDDWWDEGEAEEVFSLAEYPLTRQVLIERTITQMTASQPSLDPAELAFMRAANVKTLLMLPIVFQDRVVGLVEIMDRAERRFTDQEVSLIKLLASQAGSAIENAHLHAETQRQLKDQTALREAATAVSSTLDLEAVLGHLAEQMGRAIDATSAYIGGYQPETSTFTVLAEYFGPRACDEERVSDLGTTYDLTEEFPGFMAVLKSGQPLIIRRGDPDLPEPDRSHMRQFGAQTILAIPLQMRGQTLAFAELWESRRPREFGPDEVAICQGIAQQAGMAIENARLYEQTQQEIAERLRAEAQTRASLKEKELMLQEIHHRVKNNLQVIASLFSIQARHVEDQRTRGIFQDSRDRIRSMALVHRKMYQSKNLARVDLADYIRDLTAYLLRSHQVHSQEISLELEGDGVCVGIDTAVPCALILNELISNALKHAFPPIVDTRPGQENKIHVELRTDNQHQWMLKVSDNGIGFPPDLDFQNTTSLGLQLVNSLVNQLDGTVELNGIPDTEIKLAFPVQQSPANARFSTSSS